MTPQVPALREAMQEDEQWTAALDDGAQRDAIRFDHAEITHFHIVPQYPFVFF